MAVVPNLTDISLCEATTGWTGTPTPATNLDVNLQGTYCLQSYQAGAGNRNAIFTFAGATDLQNVNIYTWFSFSKTSIIQVKGATGLRIRLTSTGTNFYSEWDIAGSDTLPHSGWLCHTFRTNQSPSRIGAGGACNLAAVLTVGWYADSVVGKGYIYWDAWRYGQGLKVVSGISAAPVNLETLFAADDNTANKYGVISKFESVYYLQGQVQIGTTGDETFGTLSCQGYNANTAAYLDESADINSATANDVALVPKQATTQGDCMYFGDDEKFRGVKLNVGTAGVYSNMTVNWEFWNGAWTAISGITDGTNGFTTSGTNDIYFAEPSGWDTYAVNGSTKFWIRARISWTSGQTLTTAPLATQGWMYKDTYFKSTNQMVVFREANVGDAFYKIEVKANARSTTKVYIGEKSGSVGISGNVIKAANISYKFTLVATDFNITEFGLYGCSFINAGTIELPAYSTSKEMLNCNISLSNEVYISTCIVKNCNFISSPGSAILMSSISHNLTYCNFISCTVGVKIDTYNASPYPFSALMFSGSVTADVNNTSGQGLTVAKSNGSNPTTYTGSTVTFTGSVDLTMIVKNEAGTAIVGAYAFIDESTPSSPYIMNEQTIAGGIATVNWTGGPVTSSTWRVRKYGYKNYKQSVDIGEVNISLPITLIADPQQT